MVLSHAARALAKIATKKRAIAKAPRVKKAVRHRVKKVSKVHKLKKRGKQAIGSATTVGKSNTSVAAKKRAAIKEIRNMNIDRNQGIIIGVQGPIPRHIDRVPTWGITTSPTLPNAKAIKIQKAIEHVKKAKVKKGQSIIVKKGPGEWTPSGVRKEKIRSMSKSLTPNEWRRTKPKTLEGIFGRMKHPPSIKRETIPVKYQSVSPYPTGYKFFPKKRQVPSGVRSEKIYNMERFIKASDEYFGKPKGLPPRINIPTKKTSRTVAGMDKYEWSLAGGAAGVSSLGYGLGKYDEEIGEHIKGNVKAHVATADSAIDVIKERRDQLLRKLGLI